MGESKEKVGVKTCSATVPNFSQVPFVYPLKWQRYFEKLQNEKEIIMITNGKHFIDMSCSVGESSPDTHPLQVSVNEFLESRDSSVLVIIGSPGSGKTTFLLRLVNSLAKAGIESMKEIRRREEFATPPGWIPVYLKLRRASASVNWEVESFAKTILRKVNAILLPDESLWSNEPSSPQRLLEDVNLHWLLCLDGLDELRNEEEINKFLSLIRGFRLKYPMLKILITMRPVVTVPDDFQLIKISPLSREDVASYLNALRSKENESMYQEVENLLDATNGLYELCRIPLYLSVLAELIFGEPVPEVNGDSIIDVSIGSEGNIDNTPEEPKSALLPSEEEFEPRPISLEPLQEGQSDESFIGEENLDEDERTASSDDQENEKETDYGAPPLTLGWILDRAINKIWTRETKRFPIKDLHLHSWWIATGRVGLRMDGHRKAVSLEEVREEYGGESGALWVINLSIMRSSRKGIEFTHELFKYYFGASYLRYKSEEISKWKEKCTVDFWQHVEELLNQITYFGGVS